MSSGPTAGPPKDPRKATSDASSPSDGSRGSSSAKPSRHATITELELAFAQDPRSAAYIPLCEAYMEQGRFMEAMVVCKKGVKAHPDSVEPRLLLTRVYARQKKFSRAMRELDDLAATRSSEPLVFIARGEVRQASGDESGAIEDYKKAVDLDESAAVVATEALAALGIEYPEKVPEPPPPPPAASQPAVAVYGAPQPGLQPVGAPPSLGGPGATPSAPVAMPGMTPASGTIPPGTYPPGSFPPGSIPPGTYPPGTFPPQRQLLEGEEELEAMAAAEAAKAEAKGNPRYSVFLLVGCLLFGAVAVGWQLHKKQRTEAIAQLSRSGRTLFEADTYASYQQAIGRWERIIDEYDDQHALTAGYLAHANAILWAEHGDTARKPALDEALTRAEDVASDVSHTVAAKALALLYGGDDRVAAANVASDHLWPFVQKVRETSGAGTVAELSLGLIELEKGKYDEALNVLSQAMRALPRSVRAKVLHARAAFRAGKLGAAESSYSDALRSSGGGHPGARAERALLRLQRGNLAGAADDVEKFDKFAQDNPKDVSNRDRALIEFARSESLRAAGQNAAADGAYTMALRLDPNNADFPFGTGLSLLGRGQPRQALAPLRKAVEMQPSRKAFLVALADAEVQTGAYDAAAQRIEKVLATRPKDIKANVVKGALLARRGDAEAEAFHTEFVEWSKSVQSQLALARFYRRAEQSAKSRATLEKAIEQMGGYSQPVQADVLHEYASLTEALGELGTAINSYRQAANLGKLEGWYRLARLQSDGDRKARKEAFQACKRYLAAGSAQPNHESALTLCATLR